MRVHAISTRVSYLTTFLSALCLLAPAMAATFHLDASSGDDTRSGTTPDQAWRTLERANQYTFQPGDRLLLRAGTRFQGQLKPQGSGAIVDGKTNTIVVGRYGEGARPRIDADGKHLDGVLLRNIEFWEVADLEVTNLGTNREPWRTGVRVVSDGFGKMRHIQLRNLFVHDVNGDLRKSHEGCGIYFESRGANQSHFDGLLIENCHVVRTDRNGICQRTSGRGRSLGVVIRGNVLEDIGGDCIKIWGSNGALVERNVVRGGRMRCEDYAAGIWPFASDDTVIQFNEVSGMRGTKDGQGFDADYLCRRTTIQYNYSHDNEGGFILVCTPGNSYNEDTIIRYNISQNDGIKGARVFHFGGGARNTQVYNNTIYVGLNQDLPLVLCTEWDRGNARDTAFYNNLFFVDGRVTYDLGKSTNSFFENNIFYGTHVNAPRDLIGTTNRPAIVNPGGAGNGFETLKAYEPDGDALPRGRIVPNNGARDILGKLVHADKPPRIGAVE